MKSRINKIIGAVALLGVLLAPAAIAQEKGSAKGGASKLLPPGLVYPAKAAEPMKCAACKDALVSAPNREVRSAGARELIGSGHATIRKHLCATCETTFEVRGHGKAKRDVAVHICGECLAKAKAAPKAAGAPKAEVGKVTGAACCKDAWVISGGNEARPRGHDRVPKYSLKHVCPECAKIAGAK